MLCRKLAGLAGRESAGLGSDGETSDYQRSTPSPQDTARDRVAELNDGENCTAGQIRSLQNVNRWQLSVFLGKFRWEIVTGVLSIITAQCTALCPPSETKSMSNSAALLPSQQTLGPQGSFVCKMWRGLLWPSLVRRDPFTNCYCRSGEGRV